MPHIPYPLRTGRLDLRRFEAKDLQPYYDYQRLPETAQYLLNDARSYTECMGRISRFVDSSFEQEGDWASFAIVEHGHDVLLGEIALKWGSGGSPETAGSVPARVGEIGWTLAPGARGRGYATEAAQAVLDLAFTGLDFHRIEARLDARNDASAAICTRLGMEREALMRENMYLKGQWTSEAVFAILNG